MSRAASRSAIATLTVVLALAAAACSSTTELTSAGTTSASGAPGTNGTDRTGTSGTVGSGSLPTPITTGTMRPPGPTRPGPTVTPPPHSGTTVCYPMSTLAPRPGDPPTSPPTTMCSDTTIPVVPPTPDTTQPGGGRWSTTTTLAPTDREGVLQGVVTLGPTCPVERADDPCPPRYATGNVIVTGAGQSRSIPVDGETQGGSFGMLIAPGRYEVTASAAGAMSCPTESVTVTAGDVTDVTIGCDTGIR